MLHSKLQNTIGNTDIYLLDQFLKGRINENSKVLDAGCGSGRNLHLLIENNIDLTAVDKDPNSISLLRSIYPKLKEHFRTEELENLSLESSQFDFIICNAVLHFAKSHSHFEAMFIELIRVLSPTGILFIRMTSDVGISDQIIELGEGVFQIPDGSTRYLLTENKLKFLLAKNQLQLVENFKTVCVGTKELNGTVLRGMSTIVISRIDPAV